jgi:hypothetical protein
MLPIHPSNDQLLILTLGMIAAVAAVGFLFRAKDRLVDFRRDLIKAHGELSEHGMKHLSKVAECLSVGDIPGAVQEARILLRAVHDPKSLQNMLDEMFATELPNALSHPEGVAFVLKAVKQVGAATPEVLATAAKAAGLVITLAV